MKNREKKKNHCKFIVKPVFTLKLLNKNTINKCLTQKLTCTCMDACKCVYMYEWKVNRKIEKRKKNHCKFIVTPVFTLKLFIKNTINKCE